MGSSSTLAYLILTVSIVYSFAYPYFEEVSSLLSEKQKYNSILDSIDEINNKKNELMTKFASIPDLDKKNMEIILPEYYSFVKLASDIDMVALKYGIIIQNINSKNIGYENGNTINNAENSARPYGSSIIGFSFTSSYNNFKSFIDELEKSLRILDIKSLKIQPNDKGSYDFDIEFETYWLRSN